MDNISIQASVISRQDCPFKTENINCSIQTPWTDSSSANSSFSLNLQDAVQLVSSIAIGVEFGQFNATNFGPGNASIEELDVTSFHGQLYENVLMASCSENFDCGFLDSLGFVSGKGLAFYTINGAPWRLE